MDAAAWPRVWVPWPRSSALRAGVGPHLEVRPASLARAGAKAAEGGFGPPKNPIGVWRVLISAGFGLSPLTHIYPEVHTSGELRGERSADSLDYQTCAIEAFLVAVHERTTLNPLKRREIVKLSARKKCSKTLASPSETLAFAPPAQRMPDSGSPTRRRIRDLASRLQPRHPYQMTRARPTPHPHPAPSPLATCGCGVRSHSRIFWCTHNPV